MTTAEPLRMRGAEWHPRQSENHDKKCVGEKMSIHKVVKTNARAISMP